MQATSSITYAHGNENSPTNPIGRITLRVFGGGRIDLELRPRPPSNPRMWEAHAAAEMVERLLGEIHAAGFPNVAARMPYADEPLREIVLRGGGTEARMILPWGAAGANPRCEMAFRVLDSLVRQASLGHVAITPDFVPGLVAWARELSNDDILARRGITSPDGLIRVPACAEPGWTLLHEAKTTGSELVSLVKRRRTVPGEFMFLLAKDYTVAPAQVLPAEQLVSAVYRRSYERTFQKVDYAGVRTVETGGRAWVEATIGLVHEKMGFVMKSERVLVAGTHVLVLSAEGAPPVVKPRWNDVDTWFRETRFRTLEGALAD